MQLYVEFVKELSLTTGNIKKYVTQADPENFHHKKVILLSQVVGKVVGQVKCSLFSKVSRVGRVFINSSKKYIYSDANVQCT